MNLSSSPLRIFLDIIALRRGPEGLPRSLLLFLLTLMLMLVTGLAATAVVSGGEQGDGAWGWFAYMLCLGFYGGIFYLHGHSARLLQAMTAIVGCGALITLLVTVEFLLVDALFGSDIASALAALIIFWSVPVEGHIIARTIERHWYTGIAIAMFAFVLQYGLRSLLLSSGLVG